MRANSGFTLLELLIAAGILVVLLGTLGGMYVSSTRAYETNRAVTEASGQLRTAVQAIQRDFSQAGFTGRVGASFEPLDFQLEQEVQSPYQLESLTVRYVEETDDTSVTAVTYRVEDGVLWRQREGSQAQPIAEGVTELAVIRFVSASAGAIPSPSAISVQETKGLELRLSYLQSGNERSEEFTVTRP